MCRESNLCPPEEEWVMKLEKKMKLGEGVLLGEEEAGVEWGVDLIKRHCRHA